MAQPKPCQYFSKSNLDAILATLPVQGKRMLAPLVGFSERPFGLLEDHDLMENDAEVHTHEGDLWVCLEGEATFTVEGEMVDPWFKKLLDGTEDRREIKAKKISGGRTIVMRPDDILWIPAGYPHQHVTLPGKTARLLIVKIPSI